MAQQRCRVCAAKDETLAAKDQTIAVLADMVDELRARIARAPSPPSLPSPADMPAAADPSSWQSQYEAFEGMRSQERTWANDDEEELAAQLEAGAISQAAFEQGLASIQATTALALVPDRA